jgi:CBS domain-containing protein
MKVAELMQRDVKSIRSEASIAEAILTLADAHISGVPVVDGTGGWSACSQHRPASAEAEADDATSQALLEYQVRRS